MRDTADSAIIQVRNTGAAPPYYDAFVAVNGFRSPTPLKLFVPDSVRACKFASGGTAPRVTIRCDRLAAGQRIEFDADLKEGTHVETVLRNILLNSCDNQPMQLFTIDGKAVRGAAVSAHQQPSMRNHRSTNGIRIVVNTAGRTRLVLLR